MNNDVLAYLMGMRCATCENMNMDTGICKENMQLNEDGSCRWYYPDGAAHTLFE